jgi:hypothetical protein
MRTAMKRFAIAGLGAFLLPTAALGQSSAPQPKPENGNVTIFAAPKNEIVRLTTTLVVPELPVNKVGTVFLWPGLQPMPDSTNFLPIGNGVLQSVLSFGPSCAPPSDTDHYPRPDGWWVSGQYVNTPEGDLVGFRGCFGGPSMGALPQDRLLIGMSLVGAIWTQTVLNMRTRESVAFGVDLRGQAQAYARFNIEPYDGGRGPDVTFQDTTIGFVRPDAHNCDVWEQGPDDVVTARVLAGDLQSCSIGTITLKGPGVSPASKAPPQRR